MVARLVAGCLVLAVVTTPAVGQDARQIGLKAGVNFATAGGEDVDEVSSRTAFSAGFFAAIPLSSAIAIQIEALYSGKGPTFDADGSEAQVKVDYFEIPLLFRVNFPTGGSSGFRSLPQQASSGSRIVPHLYAGPAVGFKVGCKVTGLSAGDMDCSEQTFEGAHVVSGDYSGILGGGLDIGDFTVGARYSFSFNSFISAGSESSESIDVKHRVISIYAGYGFRLP